MRPEETSPFRPWALQLCTWLGRGGRLPIPQKGSSSKEPNPTLSSSKAKLRPPHPHQPLPRLQDQQREHHRGPLCSGSFCPCHLLQGVPAVGSTQGSQNSILEHFLGLVQPWRALSLIPGGPWGVGSKKRPGRKPARDRSPGPLQGHPARTGGCPWPLPPPEAVTGVCALCKPRD